MAFQVSCRSITGTAEIDLSTFQYHFCVYLTTTGKLTSGTTALTAQGKVDGIIGEGVVADDAFSMVVQDGGIAMIKLGATLAVGAEISTAADGRAVAIGASNGNLKHGILLEGGDADDIVAFQFRFMGQINA